MIDYQTYQQIRLYADQQGLKVAQIARLLDLDERTVAHWVEQKTYHAVERPQRSSKLDPFKGQIIRLIETYPYTAQQLFQRLQTEGYTGGYSILKDFVRTVRPVEHPAFLSLHFAPGQCAQVDWGSAGVIPVGSGQRRLSFFVMVLAYSRRMYVEFTLAQTQEHWLTCHQHALVYFKGVPAEIWVDNCKTAVLAHPVGQAPTFHPRYLDFARYHNFTIKACGPRQPQEKGRVESGVGYVKKNFLAGLELTAVAAANLAVRTWLDQVANLRCHRETGKTPLELFLGEAPHLKPLPPRPYETAQLHTVRATNRCHVHFEGNRYSVPPQAASQPLILKAYPERVSLYCRDQLVAEHPRSYDRRQTFTNPDHQAELLAHRRQARDQHLHQRFLALSPQAQPYYEGLAHKRANPKHHVQKIVALSEIYGVEAVQRALHDALEYQAYSAEYIANILEQRARPVHPPGALHLTRQADLLDLELPAPDLSLYDSPGGDQ